MLQLLEGATLLLCKWSQPLVAAAAARRGSNDVCATADGVVEEGDGAGGVSLPAEAGQQHRQRVVVRGCRQLSHRNRCCCQRRCRHPGSWQRRLQLRQPVSCVVAVKVWRVVAQ